MLEVTETKVWVTIHLEVHRSPEVTQNHISVALAGKTIGKYFEIEWEKYPTKHLTICIFTDVF